MNHGLQLKFFGLVALIPAGLAAATLPAPAASDLRGNQTYPELAYPEFAGRCEGAPGHCGTEPGTGLINDPALEVISTLTLRGSADFRRGEAAVFAASVRPQTTISYSRAGASASLAMGADLVAPLAGGTFIDGLDVQLNGERQLGRGLNLSGDLGLDVARLDPEEGGFGANVAVGPLRAGFAGSAGISDTRGRLQSRLELSLTREIHGNSVLDDATLAANTDRNRTGVSLDGRLGVAITPLVGGFVDWGYARDAFDAPSPSLGVFMDGTTLNAQMGLNYARGENLGGEISVGVTRRGFDDPALAETLAPGWNGSVNWVGGRGLSFDLSAGSSLDVATRAGASTQTVQSVGASASFAATEKLSLRGSGALTWTRFEGLPDTEAVASAGAGFDYAVNRFTSLTADYRFTLTEDSVSGQSSRQSVEAGLVISR
jgi:putative beta-barrel porin BBP2